MSADLFIPDLINKAFQGSFRASNVPKHAETPEAFCRMVIERYLSGASYSALAREYGIRDRTIKTILEFNGIEVRRQGRNREGRAWQHDAFSKPTPAALYWAGLLMADGSINPKTSHIALRIDPKDHAHVETFAAFVGTPDQARIYTTPGSGQISSNAEVWSETMVADLARWGIVPRKGKRDSTRPLGEATRSADFWRGVFDGDGSISWTGRWRNPQLRLTGRIGICEAYCGFVHDVVGIKLSIYRYSYENGATRVVANADNARLLAKCLYEGSTPETRLARKYTAAMEVLGIRVPPESMPRSEILWEKAGIVPFGYRVDDDRDQLVPRPDQWKAIQTMIEMRRRGSSIKAIVERTREDGYDLSYAEVRNIVAEYENPEHRPHYGQQDGGGGKRGDEATQGQIPSPTLGQGRRLLNAVEDRLAENRELRQRVARNRLAKFGYKIDPITGGIVEKLDEQAMIRTIKDMRQQGASFGQIYITVGNAGFKLSIRDIKELLKRD